MQITGYKMERCNSYSRHTGEVIVYVKKEILYEVIINETYEQNMWLLEVEMTINARKYVVGTLYHSPNASHAIFLIKLESTIDYI